MDYFSPGTPEVYALLKDRTSSMISRRAIHQYPSLSGSSLLLPELVDCKATVGLTGVYMEVKSLRNFLIEARILHIMKR